MKFIVIFQGFVKKAQVDIIKYVSLGSIVGLNLSSDLQQRKKY